MERMLQRSYILNCLVLLLLASVSYAASYGNILS